MNGVSHLYKFLLTNIADSASGSTYYTGYVFLPNEHRWKFLASFQIADGGQYIQRPGVVISALSKRTAKISSEIVVEQAWVQRDNGSWKILDKALVNANSKKVKVAIVQGGQLFNINHKTNNDTVLFTSNHPRPTIDLTRHIDSLEQLSIDLQEMNAAIQSGKIDTTGSKENVYYKILKEGTGDLVKVEDTVAVFYKGSLLKDGSVFDSTKEKPATFPLKRLIKGWQVGVPLIKVGGKIRLFIPSNLAYSIRSRSKAIPPNSVLVFDIEVVSVKHI